MTVSGAPTVSVNHAVYIVEMALAMVETIKGVKDPSKKEHSHIRIRIGNGLHTLRI